MSLNGAKQLALLLLIPNLAMAEIGANTRYSGEPSTCRILFRDRENHLSGLCSGVLVDGNKVRTAGHCVFDVPTGSLKSTIECGYQGLGPDVREETTRRGGHVWTQGPRFQETRQGSDYLASKSFINATGPDTEIDLGEIHFEPPITTIKPTRQVKSASELKRFFRATGSQDGETLYQLKPGAECKTEGYGVNSAGKSGILLHGSIDQKFLITINAARIHAQSEVKLSSIPNPRTQEQFDACYDDYMTHQTSKSFVGLAMLIDRLGMVPQMAVSGDSGGPLYCRLHPSDPWELLGVFSTYGFRGANEAVTNWAPVVDPELVPLDAH